MNNLQSVPMPRWTSEASSTLRSRSRLPVGWMTIFSSTMAAPRYPMEAAR
ncbi:hypothetical protein SAMN05216588_11023 [Pseudomonas flavescens]|uniref:Uncharacterized protein n=1 Tax=Phytopseudomonas flavescens TaxID=29435 RepID=A0A1G8H218_9GAMM|nr:hypothetical protein SAMN05216588_11023 [Pseudomonas flavescens]